MLVPVSSTISPASFFKPRFQQPPLSFLKSLPQARHTSPGRSPPPIHQNLLQGQRLELLKEELPSPNQRRDYGNRRWRAARGTVLPLPFPAGRHTPRIWLTSAQDSASAITWPGKHWRKRDCLIRGPQLLGPARRCLISSRG
jgi:hypothetical protein